MKCPSCGQEFEEIEEYEVTCDVDGCTNFAYWQGWYRVVDFSGNPTGIIRLVNVCDEHVSILIGKEESEHN